MEKKKKTNSKFNIKKLFIILLVLTFLTGCSLSSSNSSDNNSESSIDADASKILDNLSNIDTDISSELIFLYTDELTYATCFRIDRYENGYILLSVIDGSRYLCIPDGGDVPNDLDDDIMVIKSPSKSYVAASNVADYIVSMNSIDKILFSSLIESDWKLEDMAQAMHDGDISYAGKYSTPDYELLLSSRCDLAIENTMILHTPDVREKLIELGIPVIVDYSSYEDSPLGRCEWIKFYGCIYGEEENADKAFLSTKKEVESVIDNVSEERQEANLDAKNNQNVIIFYVTSSGMISVRNEDDYLSKMVELSGGSVNVSNINTSNKSSQTMQIEDFYVIAKDADILIYDTTIDDSIKSLSDIVDKNELFADFSAVKNKKVYIFGNSIYQNPMSAGYIMQDLYAILHGESVTDNFYLLS